MQGPRILICAGRVSFQLPARGPPRKVTPASLISLPYFFIIERQLSQRAGLLLRISNQNSKSFQLHDRRMLNRRCVWLWIFVLQKEFATPPNVAFRVILATATLSTARLWRTYPVRSNWRVARFSQMPRVLIYLRARKSGPNTRTKHYFCPLVREPLPSSTTSHERKYGTR